MRKYDSTKTRVTPLFDYIGVDIEKLNRMLALINPAVNLESEIISRNYGNNEKTIPPSPSLLKWCIRNYEKLNQERNEHSKEKSPETYKQRKRLFTGDLTTINNAINKIDENPTIQKKWYIFEGYTHPDIFIETDDFLLIGEAKRTENKITDKTEWLKPRDQLIRHVDALIDNTTKRIISFYLIDRKKESEYKMDRYQELNYYEKSLPHRKKKEIEQIFQSYVGYTCWDSLEIEFGIKFPDTI